MAVGTGSYPATETLPLSRVKLTSSTARVVPSSVLKIEYEIKNYIIAGAFQVNEFLHQLPHFGWVKDLKS